MTQTARRSLAGVRDLRYGRSIDAVTTIAAPLLASGAVGFLGVVAADADKFRWPGPVLFCLALAVLLLVACVQWGFRARLYLYTVAEAEEFHGTPLTAAERDWHLSRRDADLGRWRRTTGLAAACYTLGIIALAAAVALALAPRAPSGTVASWRWAASGLVALAAAAEGVWALLEWGDAVTRTLTRRRQLRRARARATRSGTGGVVRNDSRRTGP